MPDSVVPTPTPGRTGAFTAKVMALSLRASLAVSPRPTALALRSLFAKAAAARGARQLAQAPADIVAVLDERYDPRMDAWRGVRRRQQGGDRRLPADDRGTRIRRR